MYVSILLKKKKSRIARKLREERSNKQHQVDETEKSLRKEVVMCQLGMGWEGEPSL